MRIALRTTLIFLLTGLAAAGCASTNRSSRPPTSSHQATPELSNSTPEPRPTASPPTAAVSTPATSPPTTSLPPDLAPSLLGATSALIDAWEAGDRSKAEAVATPSAVNSLFSSPYAGQTVILRGCSEIAPIVCSYGPNGGASPTLSLYQLTANSVSGGWYVSSVLVES